MLSKQPSLNLREGQRRRRKPDLSVAIASPEISPFAQTGGLGEMVSYLSRALEKLGVEISLIMPAYRTVLQGGFPIKDTGVCFTVPISDRKEEGGILEIRAGNAIPVYLIRADKYFDREELYGTKEGDYPDNAERFVFFSRAILEVLRTHPAKILHAHDWQSALSIVFLKTQPHLYPELSTTKTVLTIHNLGYQGLFWHLDWHLLNLDMSLFTPRCLEFYGKINFLKGGVVFADAITTVSPTYAEEIKTPEQGFGLDGVFREREADLVGILNGADYDVWNPKTDPLIARKYGPRNISGKKVCKMELQRIFNLPQNPDVPLIGMVSRLIFQKGFDLLKEAIEDFLSKDIQLVVLGRGDRAYEDFLLGVADRYPQKVGVRIGFDEALAHRIIAGSDLILMPSRYEPGGLTQLYALKYGSIPVVRATGGLKDTVEEFDPEKRTGNGFVFEPYQAAEMLKAINKALSLFRDKRAWATLMRNAMSADFSCKHSAKAYLKLYKKLVAGQQIL